MYIIRDPEHTHWRISSHLLSRHCFELSHFVLIKLQSLQHIITVYEFIVSFKCTSEFRIFHDYYTLNMNIVQVPALIQWSWQINQTPHKESWFISTWESFLVGIWFSIYLLPLTTTYHYNYSINLSASVMYHKETLKFQSVQREYMDRIISFSVILSPDFCECREKAPMF